MLIIKFFITAVFLIVTALCWIKRRQIHLMSKLPGPSLLTMLKTILFIGFQDFSYVFSNCKSLFDKYGPIVSGWLGYTPIIFLRDPNHIEKVSIQNPLCRRFPEVLIQKCLKPIFLNGILAAEGELWKQHRKILNNTFHINLLEKFVDNFSKNGNVLADRLKEISDGSFHRLDIMFTQCTMDIVIETMFAYDLNVQKRNDVEVVENTVNVIDFQMKRILKPWLFIDWIFEMSDAYRKIESVKSHLHGFVREGLNAKINYFNSIQDINNLDPDVMKNVNTLAYALSSQLSEEDCVGDATSIVGAGAETSATICCFALTLLCENQDIQKKILEEQMIVFGEDFLRPVTKEDLPCMPYLEQVLKETLRLFPAIPFGFRVTENEVDLGNNHVIPTGSWVLVNMYETHRLPEFFPNPEKFDPERFSPENCLGRHPYAYIPFGLGRRICVGSKYAMMEMKTLMSTVLRRFQFIEVEGGVKGINDSLKLGLVLKPDINFNFKFLPR